MKIPIFKVLTETSYIWMSLFAMVFAWNSIRILNKNIDGDKPKKIKDKEEKKRKKLRRN